MAHGNHEMAPETHIDGFRSITFDMDEDWSDDLRYWHSRYGGWCVFQADHNDPSQDRPVMWFNSRVTRTEIMKEVPGNITIVCMEPEVEQQILNWFNAREDR
jgi:hypothetical protein